MRKTKANLKRQSSGPRDRFENEALDNEAIETEREERYQAMTGETATEGLGPGFTNDPAFENSIQTLDGPLAGDVTDPPGSEAEVQRTEPTKGERKRMKKKKIIDKGQGNHTAARSAKKL